jgi:AcrR family transcriptional regulator
VEDQVRLTRLEMQRQTRQRLLDSAQEVFARHGFVGASVDEIAEHAGYSKGAVYSNFKSKEALFLELLQNRMSKELGELEQLLRGGGSIGEILLVLRQRYSSLEKQVIWCLLSTEFQLQAGRNPDFAEPFAALYRNQRKAIAKLAALVAEKAGTRLTWNGEELATSLMALTHGIALQRAADPKSVSAETAGKAIQLFLTAALSNAGAAAAKGKSGKKAITKD